jgi:hypothetical protein
VTKRLGVWFTLEERTHLMRAIRERAKHPADLVREILAIGHGMIIRIRSDKDLLVTIEAAHELLDELRAFISTRARGEKGP